MEDFFLLFEKYFIQEEPDTPEPTNSVLCQDGCINKIQSRLGLVCTECGFVESELEDNEFLGYYNSPNPNRVIELPFENSYSFRERQLIYNIYSKISKKKTYRGRLRRALTEMCVLIFERKN